MREFDVGIIGSRYVGLVTGACLARLGHRVTCLDRDVEFIGKLSEGRMPFHEPGLGSLVRQGVGERRLHFVGAEALEAVVRNSDALFIAVGTPQDSSGAADLSNVAAVARGIGRALAGGDRRLEEPLLVVNKSTVPVGSGDYVSMLIEEGAEGAEVDFRVVSNPEFLREGSAIHDTFFPDRIVVGSEQDDALELLRELYRPIVERNVPVEGMPQLAGEVPFVTTDLLSAEMIKYAANAFLATKISFINEVSNICDLTGADVESVAAGIGLDDRIGPRFLEAGVGWGGSCFPKDVDALRATAREYGYEPVLLDATVAVNEHQRDRVITMLQQDLHDLRGERIVLLGLAFKPGTDDLREAPSLAIASALQELGAHVAGYDPVAGEAAAKLLPNLEITPTPYEALEGARAAVVVTEWEDISGLDLSKAAARMESPRLLIDGRNALDPDLAREYGLLYRGFGRG